MQFLVKSQEKVLVEDLKVEAADKKIILPEGYHYLGYSVFMHSDFQEGIQEGWYPMLIKE